MIDDCQAPAERKPRRFCHLQAMRIFRKVPFFALALSAPAWAGAIELPHIPAPEAWHEVFAYCQEVSAEFNEIGDPVVVRRPVSHTTTSAVAAPDAMTY